MPFITPAGATHDIYWIWRVVVVLTDCVLIYGPANFYAMFMTTEINVHAILVK